MRAARTLLILAHIVLAGALLPASARAEAPKVVASIKPVHSIIAAVMRGVGTPVLLVGGNASPHDYTFRPSDARALAGADVVFWIGEALETFMVKPLELVPTTATVVTLMESPEITLLEGREGGAWEPHVHLHEHPRQHAGAGRSTVNPHVWLDPMNAKDMAERAAVVLATRDPDHAELYRANADAFEASMIALDGELKLTLAPVADRPFIVFHDAYAYFEKRYGLNAVGAITVNPEQRPSARRVAAIRDRIKAGGAVCVFAEPEFEPKLVDTLIAGTGARKGVLDPEGAAIPEGPDLYPTLLRGLALGLVQCLSPRP